MISIQNKIDCCGCNVCGDACAKKAISFVTDEEGFLYPQVDKGLCVECGRCEKVCPMLNLDAAKNHGQHQPKVYGAYHKNIAIRFDSTSGGVFSALANAMYKQGGYVSGAVFNEDWTVSNFISNNKKDLARLRSSKYVQSNAEGLYTTIRKLLEQGEHVLACGSPCQMAALRTYLGKDYDNLIIVDFLCRATNSPKAYRKYLDYLEETFEGKIVYIKAKNKDHGWRSLARKVLFDNGRVYYGEGHEDHYRRGYHANFFERPSCYDCKFKGMPRIADITLADFWGVERVAPKMDNNLGTSLVFVNTEKGEQFFDSAASKLEVKKYSFDEIHLYNKDAIWGGIKQPNVDREQMFRDMDTMRFDKVAEKYFPLPKPQVIKMTWMAKFKRYINKMIGLFRHPKQSIRAYYWNHHPQINGNINIETNCAIDLREGAKITITGQLFLGLKKNKKSKLETRLLLEENAAFNVKGVRRLMYNSDIQVFKNAELVMGSGNCNSGLQIVCAERIDIGNNTYIGRDVWIRDNNGGHYIIQAGYTNTAPVKIGDYCWIGSNVVIMKGVTIGDGAVIAANSVVTTNIPAHCLASGNPAIVVSENITWVH